ncbi:hypothetical protein MASR1M65_03970 [Saprospiraceae bacterium]
MTPAREALRRLAAEGALTLSSSGRVTTPELATERIEELAAIRALLEPEMAARALPRAHFALIERLAAINAAERRGGGEAAMRWPMCAPIWSFTARFTCAPRPRRCWPMAETVWLQLGPTMRAVYARLRRTEPPQHHRMILAALKAGDEPGRRSWRSGPM